MKRILVPALFGLLAVPAFAEGDAEAGKKTFNKCKSCHLVTTPDGEAIVKGGKTGPNLYGIGGRPAGSVEGFKYGDSLVAVGENGLVWDEASFVEYSQDPKTFLKTYLDDTSAKSKMTFKLKSGGEDVYAYLVSISAE
ncbi:MAG: c-type cytochrome [Ruegeria sp.]